MNPALLRPLFLPLMILLFSSLLNAQNNTYDSLWKSVTSLEKEGLPQSALKVVERIATKALKAKNDSQYIKSLLFKSKYTLTLEEDAQLKIINDFKLEIAQREFPSKNILESLLANLYWQYFKQNKWKFYNRTKTEIKADAEDFRTWDLQTLFYEIHLHHQNALQNGLLLQLEPLEKYDSLLQTQQNSKRYRPTLYDFLNHNALEFYKTTETHITKPAYTFEIDQPNFIAPAATFSKLNITSKDTIALQLHALKIYKNLIHFHLKDSTPSALVDINIQRLKFVKTHATFSAKDTLFLNSLKTEKKQHPHTAAGALYDFEIARIYYNQSKHYIPLQNETSRWKAKEALDLCKAVIAKHPKSTAAKHCTLLSSEITSKTLEITTESTLPIQQEARLLVRYKNRDSLTFKAYKLSHSQFKKFQITYRNEEKWAYIQKLNAVRSWKTVLKNEADYQTHSTEVILPKLNNGRYIIVATSTAPNASNFAFAHVQISDIAVLEHDSPTYKTFQCVSRNDGSPISDAKVELSYTKWNSKQPTYKNITTNQLGDIQLKKTPKSRKNTINLKITHNNTISYFGAYYLNQRYNKIPQKTNYTAFIFTDRSLYRPGQTLHFKAIAIEKNETSSLPLDQRTVVATLHNTNGETVETLNLKTNTYGAVSGTFTIPLSGLNGQYHITVAANALNLRNNHYISVEDYKRPKFETKFKPVTSTYRVNDTITTKGYALAYAGSPITNAKVVYRVHRKVQYPHWYFWYRPYFNQESTQDITHGSTTTDAQGNFAINFKALPAKNVDKTGLPIFKYEVTADVTDLNGETRSSTQHINVGYHSITAALNIAPRLDKTKKDHTLSIQTTNLNGEFTAAKGRLKIYKLQAPQTVLRKRPWPAPDYQTFSKAQFKTLFPHDAYTNEDTPDHWKKGTLMLDVPFNTETTKTLKLNKLKKWASGYYIITLDAKDAFGQWVKDEIKTILFSPKDNTLADQQLFHSTTDKTSYKTGDNAKITIASAATPLAVTLTVEKDKTVISKQIITLNNTKKTITVPVTKADLGGFTVHYSFVAFNSFQSGTIPIAVPYPKSNLHIETLTFRDKLQPGTDETWTFKIKGPYGDKLSAELLASMYDASLDQFKPQQWAFSPRYKPNYNTYSSTTAHRSFGTTNFTRFYRKDYVNYPQRYYDQFNWFGLHSNTSHFVNSLSGKLSEVGIANRRSKRQAPQVLAESLEDSAIGASELAPLGIASASPKDVPTTLPKLSQKDALAEPNLSTIQTRTNLKETAFFFPHLNTDANGHVSFSFKTPEALTQWKLQMLAHTKTLESTTSRLTTVTQKEVMVIPNAPRFLRAGDTISISTKIVNLTDKTLNGHAKLILTDAISGKAIAPERMHTTPSTTAFTVTPIGNTQVSWQLYIPEDLQAVQYKIVAQSGAYSDGEQNTLPVLTNRMLVTETLPMWVNNNSTKTFTLNSLKTNSSTTLKHHKLTLEVTSNPAWYAIQALPYLMEYPYDCNEQTFSKFYANALAQHVANTNPKIKAVFQQWRSSDALIAQLEKNPELKSILIEETPWLRDAQHETEQKKRIALLFDLNKMRYEAQTALRKLESNQMPSGAWSWFKGGRDNRYITQHIIAGFGHLKQLGISNANENVSQRLIKKALYYLDQEFIKTYKALTKYNANADLNKDHLSYIQWHYLYMRSFFPNVKRSKQVEEITTYYQTQIQKYWLKRSLYAKGMMALIAHRAKDQNTASKILNSLKETSITSEELGMYWKSNTNSWYWHQAPIETQALLIEAFAEAGTTIQSEIQNNASIDNLKIWLLKHKQTNRWKTTKATSEAIYALLLQGSDWLDLNETVAVSIGGKALNPERQNAVKVEAGTGYYKTCWKASEITPEMGTVQLSKTGKGIAWGSLYWQYFENLDHIGSAKTPLQLKKKLFLKKNSDYGEVLSEITKTTPLHIGDLVRVRIELRNDRPMEFVHMKDMRAAGLEPINVHSRYKWQDGLGYYESTKDAATHFFFDNLPKGIFIFEYDLRVNNAGRMSNGITTIQSMYAPEFSSHSEGVRVVIN